VICSKPIPILPPSLRLVYPRFIVLSTSAPNRTSNISLTALFPLPLPLRFLPLPLAINRHAPIQARILPLPRYRVGD